MDSRSGDFEIVAGEAETLRQ